MLYIKLFIEREKNTGQSAPECPFNMLSAAEERCEPSGKCHGIVRELSGNCQGISHCLESRHPEYNQYTLVHASPKPRLIERVVTQRISGVKS